MKILCLHRELIMPGGSETFMLAIIKELNSIGHDVWLYTLKSSHYIEEFKKYCIVIETQNTLFSSQPDAIFSMHRPMAPFAMHFNCHKTMISNGILPIGLAVPGFDRYVSVSEEVQNANKSLGFDSDIIYNGIDIERFYIKKPIRKKLKNVLFISNHCPGVINTVFSACSDYNLFCRHIGGTNHKLDVENMINSADLVISLGRGCYEAMACGRNIIIFDYRGGDGFVTPETFPIFRRKNCSGRNGQFPYNSRTLGHLFKFYNPDLSPFLRDIIINEHNIKTIVQKLLLPLIPE